MVTGRLRKMWRIQKIDEQTEALVSHDWRQSSGLPLFYRLQAHGDRGTSQSGQHEEVGVADVQGVLERGQPHADE